MATIPDLDRYLPSGMPPPVVMDHNWLIDRSHDLRLPLEFLARDTSYF